jgi:betaine-aldehyde dehydrogenase
MIAKETLFIGGDWIDPAGPGRIELVEPATEEILGSAPHVSRTDIDRAVSAARQAFDAGPWAVSSPNERADVMSALSAQLQGRAEELAHLITRENGSPISMSMMLQVFAGTVTLDYYAALARTFPFEERRKGAFAPEVIVRHEPVGVVGAIVPWNVPLFIAMLKIGPALAAGNTVVLKPSPETALDAYILAECAQAAGLPPGVLNIVAADREVSEYLVTHPDVDKISFTGSSRTGRRIASLCGELLRRCTLELGGKSAAIVLDDADLGAHIQGLVVGGSLPNNGEACAAQTRILASRDRYDEVVDTVVETVRALPTGDPLDPNTVIGPMVSQRQQDVVLGYIAKGRDEGAKVAVGGGVPKDLPKGWYVEPTVFVDVHNRMTIAQEEIFGPVIVVIPFDDVDDAVRIANDSSYGLSGSVWTRDQALGLDIARRVRTGTFGINGMGVDAAGPFGGFKCSGLGREFGPEGLLGYLEAKTIVPKTSSS